LIINTIKESFDFHIAGNFLHYKIQK